MLIELKHLVRRFVPCRNLSLPVYLRVNFFRGKTRGAANARILPFKNTVCDFDPSAEIALRGNLALNTGKPKGSKAEMLLRLEKGAYLEVRGDFGFAHDCDICVFENAGLVLGRNSYLNEGCEIRCKRRVTIGDHVAISRRVQIWDSDVHTLVSEDGNKNTVNSPVVIGNHVWIGTGSLILKGVTLGEGAVIAAGAVVNRDIPPHCLAAGVPAKVIKKNVHWEL